ncbi:methyltransferase domain-containing protein [Patescibacteria group bacterium]|nr:methyltransferase domain-containing protein [Patescibacteria group bacterium]
MAFVRPEEVIKQIGIEPGMVVADFGAGSGHYSIAAAKIVRNTGKVYSVDIQKELLGAIKSTANLNNLSNVEIVWSDLESREGSRLADNSVNVIIISNILFQVENKEVLLKEAIRILKEDGKLAVIEWEKEKSKMGPPLEKRISKNECQEIFKNIGFNLKKEFTAGENHYGLIFIKR